MRCMQSACKGTQKPFLFVIPCSGKTAVSPVLLGLGDIGQGRPGVPMAYSVGTPSAKPVWTGKMPTQLPVCREMQKHPFQGHVAR